MAATNYTPIQLYYSSTASAAPIAGNLANGELAINITDGKLYYKDNGGVVQVIATKGAGTIGGSTTQIQYNNAGALAGSAAMTFNSGTNTTTLTTLNLTNALGATYGGTAQSAYAQGDVLYASATNTLSKLGIGTVNYILTSTGSVPQWVAPTSITVQTATNLAGGAAGSVPYQSGAATTTFLAIGAADRVMTSSGTAPQWVTALTGLTGVSSSSITNTSLTSTRLVYSTTGGAQTDSANLTFNGTTLSTTGLSNTGFSTLVKTLTLGDANFNGSAVFAPGTPAKLYMGTGTVTDVTSAASATNTTGAIASLAITPIAATNTAVTYTNASTLYIAGAPSAGTNITITNPYSLYVAAGASYFGGAVTVAGSISLAGVTVTSLTDSGLTSGRVTYAGTGGLLQDSANLTFSGTILTSTGFAGPLNGTVGATTANTGSFTTLSASGLISSTAGNNANIFLSSGATTGYQFLRVNNTSGDMLLGVEGATPSLITDSTAYDTVLRGTTGISFSASNGSAKQMRLSSTGLAVTGLVSATTAIRLGTATSDELFTINGSSAGFVARITNTTASNPNGLYINSTNAIGTGTAFRVDSAGTSLLTLNTTGVTLAGSLGAGRNPVARLDSYTTTASQSALIATSITPTGATSAATITIGANDSAYSGGYGLRVLDKTANGGGAQTGFGVYIAAPYDGTNASGGTYALAKYGLYIDDIYSYYGINSATANANFGIYVKGGANNYIAGTLGIGTTSPTTTSAGGSFTLGDSKTHIYGDSSANSNSTAFSAQKTTLWIENNCAATNSEYAKSALLISSYEGASSNPGPMARFYRQVYPNAPARVFEVNYLGNIGLGDTNASTSGTGITFPATQSASSDANTLDDYEEGTWTAVMPTESGTNYTITSQTSRYVKIGNIVTVNSNITYSAVGNGTISRVTLPFTPAQSPMTISFSADITGTSGGSNLTTLELIPYTSNELLLRVSNINTNYWSPTSSWASSGSFVFNGTFII